MHIRSRSGGTNVLHVRGSTSKRSWSIVPPANVLKLPMMAWHKQIRALLPTSDLKPSQHVLGGAGTESMRYGAHVITRPSAPKQLAGCCEGEGDDCAPTMPGKPGNGGNAGRGGGAGMKTATPVKPASASWSPARCGTDGALTACALCSDGRIVAAASAAYVRSKTIDLVSAIVRFTALA